MITSARPFTHVMLKDTLIIPSTMKTNRNLDYCIIFFTHLMDHFTFTSLYFVCAGNAKNETGEGDLADREL